MIERTEILIRQAESGSMGQKITVLEQRALHVALAGREAWMHPLREQVPRLRVTARKSTGVGFFTTFACDGCRPLTGQMAKAALHQVPVAWVNHPDLLDGTPGTITFNVFVKAGMIECLEAASCATWPRSEDQITVLSKKDIGR